MSFVKIDWARLWALDVVAFYLVELAGNGALVTDIGFFSDGVVTMESMSVIPSTSVAVSHDRVFLLRSVL